MFAEAAASVAAASAHPRTAALQRLGPFAMLEPTSAVQQRELPLFSAPRGTADVLPAEQPYWRQAIDAAERLCRLFGYARIDTPIFEQADLFERGAGEGSDVVRKEMYVFEDRSGERLALKPEGTASICRAYLQHGMGSLPQPVRLYYAVAGLSLRAAAGGTTPPAHAVRLRGDRRRRRRRRRRGHRAAVASLRGPRPERPRPAPQHHRRPEVPARATWRRCAPTTSRTCAPSAATAATATSATRCASSTASRRAASRSSPPRRRLSTTSATTAASTSTTCAATSTPSTSPTSSTPHLVRGLDYYTRTVFEVQPRGGGAQSTIGAGGRYDGLIEELGGKPTPATGFATGIERIVLNMKQQKASVPPPAKPHVYVAHQGVAARVEAFKLASLLRREGVSTVIGDRRAQPEVADATGERAGSGVGRDPGRAGACGRHGAASEHGGGRPARASAIRGRRVPQERFVVKVILSRKGFDSSSGGVPSPIFPNGRMLSLPIPEADGWASPDYTISYENLMWPGQPGIPDIVSQLTRGKVQGGSRVHIDPDIYGGSLPREHGWRPIFGQADAAQAHLLNCGVGPGDLFLFFGLFQKVDEGQFPLRFSRPWAPQHVIFGWLQVEMVLEIGECRDRIPWALYHPHVHSPQYSPNTLYVSSEELRFDASRPGAGAFAQYSDELRLTARHQLLPSTWLLPSWFAPQSNRKTLTYHGSRRRWSEPNNDGVILRSVGRGQEFVLDCEEYPESHDWLADLFHNAPPTRVA